MAKEVKEKKESKIKGNSLGAAGFTLGVIGVLAFGVIGLILSIVGFVLCFIQQKNRPTKLGKAGLILNVIGIVLSIVYIILIAPLVTKYLQSLNGSGLA